MEGEREEVISNGNRGCGERARVKGEREREHVSFDNI